MNYNDNGVIKQITVKSGDTLPVGTIVEFDGTTIPAGYEEVEEDKKILWVNNGSLTYFAAQNINFDFQNCDLIEMFYIDNSADTNRIKSTRIIKDKNSAIDYTSISLGGQGGFGERTITYLENGYSISSFNFTLLNGDGGTNDTFIIPLYIVGYKTGLFGGNE